MKYLERYWLVILIVFGVSMFIKPALGMLIIGSLLFCSGIETILFLRKIKKKGVESLGEILEFESDDDGYKTPLIEFSPLSGGLIKAKPSFYASSDLSRIRSYKNMINQTIPILYDPDDPEKFILADENEFNYFFLVFLFIVSTIFIIVSISSFLGYIKLS